MATPDPQAGFQWGPIITHVIAAGAGILVGVIKPTTEWFFEKKRSLRANRLKLIDDCYKKIQEVTDRVGFSKTAEFSRIKPYLSQKTIDFIEKDQHVHIVQVSQDREGRPCGQVLIDCCLKEIQEELSRLETKWGLK